MKYIKNIYIIYKKGFHFISISLIDIVLNVCRFLSHDILKNFSGRSYVVGFGEHPPQQVYNPAASCRPPPETCTWEDALRNKPNPHILYGALVSGPDIDDIFMDIRMRASYTEAAIYYNAGFTGVLAGLIQLRKEILENKQDYTEKIGVV